MSAIGRSAAATEPFAFAMPAPQAAVVQIHSSLCMSDAPVGTWHTGTFALSLVVGYGLAPSFRRAMSCVDFRLPLTASINPAMPETMGAEKLVPTLMFVWSVYEFAAGVVVPRFVVVSMEKRHG